MGGQSTIARALKSIQEQYEFTTQWEAIKKKISNKSSCCLPETRMKLMQNI